MTQMLETQTPDLIGTGAQVVVETANRLGLTWSMRIGTITEINSMSQLVVQIDGDENPITMTSMIGVGSVGRKVYVITVPPSANFVVGNVNRPQAGQRIATTVRVTNSAGHAGTEVVTDSVTGQLQANLTYKISAQFVAQSTVANDMENARIREDSLAGGQLAVSRVFIPASGAGFFVHLEFEYTPTADELKTFVLTGQRVVGSGTITHAAGTNNPTTFYIDYIRDYA